MFLKPQRASSLNLHFPFCPCPSVDEIIPNYEQLFAARAAMQWQWI
jgi:hypothetical protein